MCNIAPADSANGLPEYLGRNPAGQPSGMDFCEIVD